VRLNLQAVEVPRLQPHLQRMKVGVGGVLLVDDAGEEERVLGWIHIADRLRNAVERVSEKNVQGARCEVAQSPKLVTYGTNVAHFEQRFVAQLLLDAKVKLLGVRRARVGIAHGDRVRDTFPSWRAQRTKGCTEGEVGGEGKKGSAVGEVLLYERGVVQHVD